LEKPYDSEKQYLQSYPENRETGDLFFIGDVVVVEGDQRRI